MASGFTSMAKLWKLEKILSTPPSQQVQVWLGILQSGIRLKVTKLRLYGP
jgi:hypothetical protein